MKIRQIALSFVTTALLAQLPTMGFADEATFVRTQFANLGDRDVQCIDNFFTRIYRKPLSQWATDTLGAERLANWKRDFSERRAAQPAKLFADFDASFRATLKTNDIPAADWASIKRAMGSREQTLKAAADRLLELRKLAQGDQDTFYDHEIIALDDFLFVQNVREQFASASGNDAGLIAKTCNWGS